MKCPDCGTRMTEQREVQTLRVADRTFSAEVPVRLCPKCGHGSLSGPAMKEFELRAARELARAGVRTGDTFRFMRKTLGLTAAELAELLEVSAETISRWERGQRDVDWPAFIVLWWLVDDRLEGRADTLERIRGLRRGAAPLVTRLDLKSA